MTKIKSKTTDNTILMNGLLFIGILLAFQFIYHVCWMAQVYAVSGEENAPKTYTAVACLLIALFVWAKSSKHYQKYIIVSILTAIVIGYLIWGLGTTGAGHYLITSTSFWL
jgi:hypothetical protein